MSTTTTSDMQQKTMSECSPFARGVIVGGSKVDPWKATPQALEQPLKWKRHRHVIVLSDLFHGGIFGQSHDDDRWIEGGFEQRGFDFLVDVINVIRRTPQHTYQILTKRPRIMADMWPRVLRKLNISEPLPNVWLGCSVEDQKTADERIPHLLKCPAAVRFLSVEPQVGDIEYRDEWASGIHWMIGGGESGKGARPYDIAWPRKGIAWAKRHRIAWFQKQLGLRPFLADHAFCPQCVEWRGVDGLDVAGLGDQLECRECHKRKRTKTGQPQRMPSGKGSDPSEWPTDLRVRQVPGGAA